VGIKDCFQQTAFEFEGGRVAHVVLLHDELERVPEAGLTSFSLWPTERWNFEFYLAQSVIRLRYVLGLEGMTVLLMGGVGRGFALPPTIDPPGWFTSVIHLADAVSLSWVEDDWLSCIWRANQQVSALRREGLNITEQNDHARVIAYWHDRERFVPLDVAIPGAERQVDIDSTFVANTRAEARRHHDEHASYMPSCGAWYRVAKLFGQAHFDELASLPLYGSIPHAELGTLVGVVETRCRTWWVTLEHVEERDDGNLRYEVWEAMMQWCGRILPLIDERTSYFPGRNLEIEIHADVPDLSALLRSESLADLVSFSTDANRGMLHISLQPGFFGALAEPANRAERALIGAVFSGIIEILGAPLWASVDQLVA